MFRRLRLGSSHSAVFAKTVRYSKPALSEQLAAKELRGIVVDYCLSGLHAAGARLRRSMAS